MRPEIFSGMGFVCAAPAEVLTRVLQPLWSVALAVARDEQAEAQASLADAELRIEAPRVAEVAKPRRCISTMKRCRGRGEGIGRLPCGTCR